MIFILFLIAIGATLVGALAGLGGGVIIKPMMQMITPYTLLNINVISSITVFTMATISLIKRKRDPEFKFFDYAPNLIIGSIIGGLIGNKLFGFFANLFTSDNALAILQTGLLLVLLIVVVVANKIGKKLAFTQNNITMVIYGMILAILCAFLGIGGGPINVAFFFLLLNIDIKTSTLMSITIIFFSQLTNIITYVVDGTLANSILTPLILMVPGAVIGGNIGANLSKKLPSRTLLLVYNVTVVGLIFLNFYNLISYL